VVPRRQDERHVQLRRPSRRAGSRRQGRYYWEGEPEGDRREITFADLERETTRLANALKELGVRKGTPVGIYMGMVPETPVAMLACARIGAPHTVVFGGFSADSLSDRLVDMECEVLITQDEAWRRGTTVPLKRTADTALESAPSVKNVIVLRRTGNDVPMQEGRDHWWHDVATDETAYPAEPMDSRTSSICSTRAARPRSRRGSRTRRPATSSASRRRTTTSST
jgi:acetyl-CoA synthetase